MQLVDKTLSPAVSVSAVQRPIAAWLLTGLLMASVLVGCSTNTPAPITDIHSSTPSTAESSTQTAGNYTVEPGDTLFKIALKYGSTVQAIAEANNITDPSQLRVGQVLSVKGATTPSVVVTAPASVSAPTTMAGSDSTVAEQKVEPVPSPVSPVATDALRASDAGLVNWGWPASGTLIQGFTASTKGIDIKGEIGDPIIAAADGKVVYAGNGLRGLGNLILLDHTNGFITAYAHNDTLLVKTGQKITKGQQIATLGESDTTSPHLHFEVRRRNIPVNPLSYLPAR